MAVTNLQQLDAWAFAMELAEMVHQLTLQFPKHELFALSDQMRRAAISVPSSIAEGQGRGRGKDFRRYLRIAIGSLQELHTQLLLSQRFGYIHDEQLQPVMAKLLEVTRLTKGLLRSIRL